MKNKTCRQINERDLILSDPIICAVLEIEAEKAGVTLEEYVIKFLEVFYQEPQRFYDILRSGK